MNINLIREGKPKMQAGKGGLSDTLVSELKDHIKKDGLVKVKASPSAYGSGDRKEFFSQLAEKAGVKLIEVRGHTAIFSKN